MAKVWCHRPTNFSDRKIIEVWLPYFCRFRTVASDNNPHSFIFHVQIALGIYISLIITAKIVRKSKRKVDNVHRDRSRLSFFAQHKISSRLVVFERI